MLIVHRVLDLPVTATNGSTSNVGEPSVAATGDKLLVTGNWYAASSLDGGRTWRHLDPGSYLSPQPPTDFCCDQAAIYDPSRKLVVQVLQYKRDASGNTLRLAVNRGATLADADWRWWDLTPSMVDPVWSNAFFDYNHLAISDNCLYLGSNLVDLSTNVFRRSVVLRFPLDDLATRDALPFEFLESTDNGVLRCAAGARDVMYVVGQVGNLRQLRVFSWPETGVAVPRDVPVSPWAGGKFVSLGPDQRNWLGRCDDRITGAWVADGQIGVLWTSNSLGPKRPHPFVRAALIDGTTMTVSAEPDIWSGSYSYAYPDAYPNEVGMVGVTLLRGGRRHHPGHLVDVLEESGERWKLRLVASSTHDPADEKWGDYLSCRRADPDGRRWIAAGFTLRGGGEPDFVQQHLV